MKLFNSLNAVSPVPMAIAFGVLLLMPSQLPAAIVQFDLDYQYSPTGVAPTGGTPWLTATFDDGGTVGSVTLTMSAPGLTDPESVGAWYFNSTEGGLNFSWDGSSVEASSIDQASNAFKAGPDGYFDIRMNFTNGSFTNGNDSIYEITGAGITAETFNTLSFISGSNIGPFHTAAHILNINGLGMDSGWIAPSADVPAAVPVPPVAVLLGSGLVGLIGLGRRWRGNI